MAFTSTLSGLSLVGTDRTLTVSCGEQNARQTHQYNLVDRNAQNFMGYGHLERLLAKLGELGPIYMTVDTFMFLVLDRRVIPNECVSGVFPWKADEAAMHPPAHTTQADTTCRRVAWYYWHMHYHHVTDWQGSVTTFAHRASNTISHRAYAPYQVVTRERRAQIAPERPSDAAVLQFDWTGAEWLLILQKCGYDIPADDPYAVFGVDREAAKKVVLPRIYGATVDGLVNRNKDLLDYEIVEQVLRGIEDQYPDVLEWVSNLDNPNNRFTEFHGFELGLGEDRAKRANRWAQTSLQLCKWDLIGRLTDIPGMSRTRKVKKGRVEIEQPWSPAAGDLHDQLFFDVYQGEEALAQNIINEIQAPCFDEVRLTPKFTTGRTWS